MLDTGYKTKTSWYVSVFRIHSFYAIYLFTCCYYYCLIYLEVYVLPLRLAVDVVGTIELGDFSVI